VKFPVLEKLGLLITQKDGTQILNEKRFFAGMTFPEFREYEDNSSYPKIKLNEVESFLASKQKST
jgi:hypothetical protein